MRQSLTRFVREGTSTLLRRWSSRELTSLRPRTIFFPSGVRLISTSPQVLLPSLGASNPLFSPSEILKKVLEEIDLSNVRFYQSRSSVGNAELKKVCLAYYESLGFNVPSGKLDVMFTDSEFGILRLLIEKILKTKEEKFDALVAQPTFNLFSRVLEQEGVGYSTVKTNPEDGWKITPAALKKSLQDNSNLRLFIFINPDNPTGLVYSQQEVEALSQIIIEHNLKRQEEGKNPLIVMSDEASRDLIYDEAKTFFSIGKVVGMEDCVVTTSSLSKILGPGLAISHTIAPKPIIDALTNNKEDALTTDKYGPCALSQGILEAVLRDPKILEEHKVKSVTQYRANLGLVKGLIAELNEKLSKFYSQQQEYIKMPIDPEAGLCCLLQFPAFLGAKSTQDGAREEIDGSQKLHEYLSKAADVQLLPGNWFGCNEKEMMFRITVSKEPEVLQKCFDLIYQSLAKLEIERPAQAQASAVVAPQAAERLAAQRTVTPNLS